MFHLSKLAPMFAAAVIMAVVSTSAEATYNHKPEPEPCCEDKTILFHETFENYSYDKVYVKTSKYSGYYTYTDFPDQKPSGDPVRLGIPMPGNPGSDENWYAAELDSYADADTDTAVQRIGGGSNNTHTGRVGDNAGLLLNIDASNYENLEICFDYRTFSADYDDKFKVYYFVGDLEVDGKIVDLSLGDLSGWTKLLEYRGDTWKHFEAELDADCAPSVWVLFMMYGGDSDYGKFDNVMICGDEKPDDTDIVPAPAALPAGLALVGLLAARRRRNA